MKIGGVIALLLWIVAVRRASRSMTRTQLAVFAVALLLLVGGVLGAETVADPTANHRIRTYDWRYLGVATVGFLAAAGVIAATAITKRESFVRSKAGAIERGVIVLLPVGGIAFGLGWCVIMLMLWTSRAWSRREKLLATLALPGGPIVAFLMYDSVASSGWPDVIRTPVLAMIIAAALLPTAAAIFLARCLRGRASSTDPTPGLLRRGVGTDRLSAR